MVTFSPLRHYFVADFYMLDLTGAGDTPISRRKSFKKSLRESFRRLRKGRSTRRQNAASSPQTNTRKAPPAAEEGSPLDAKPVERQIEARPVDDAMGSIVRCLYFARTFLVSGNYFFVFVLFFFSCFVRFMLLITLLFLVQNTIPTLWAGTNNGTVYVFTIVVPSSSKRESEDIVCQLAKEIQLKHRYYNNIQMSH